MSSTTETRSVPTYQLFYSRPGSLTPPTTSLHLHTRPKLTRLPLSLPSSLSLPPGLPRTPSHPIHVISPIFSSGTASATPGPTKPVSRQVVDEESPSAGDDVPLTTGPPTVLTSDSEGEHFVLCDATTPPTTLASSSPPSTSPTTSKPRSKRVIRWATRSHRKPRTKPTPPELLDLNLEPSTYPTPNLLSQWKPHSPSSILATPTLGSPTANVAPVEGTIAQPGSTHAQRKS
ncbi:hypothetical protein FRC05_006681 [Tulasnella sp. 425]|nr:hypothetical protein FRC05_006681 [Tulasnella sp. 425]